METQERSIAACAAANGYTLVQNFRDSSTAGNGTDQPGLTALLSKIADSHARAVIVDDLTRFIRDPGDLGEIVKILKGHDVAVYLAAEGGVAL